MKPTNEEILAFASKHHLDHKQRCNLCSTEVFHEAVDIKKDKDSAYVMYAPCPKRHPNSRGGYSSTPISAKEKRRWQDLYWGIRGNMEGYDPNFIAPNVQTLDESKVYDLERSDSPYAVFYDGICDFVSLVAKANEDWEESPYSEELAEYVFMVETSTGFHFNVSSTTPNARMVTVVYWDEPATTQRIVLEQTKGDRKQKRNALSLV